MSVWISALLTGAIGGAVSELCESETCHNGYRFTDAICLFCLSICTLMDCDMLSVGDM